MRWWARDAERVAAGIVKTAHRFRKTAVWSLVLSLVAGSAWGCSQQNRKPHAIASPPRVLVLAPVLNLSGSPDFDPLKVTDLIASECLGLEGLAVVPVNLTLAELVRQGKRTVETPEDAFGLARAFGADGTLVVAITEYDPYDPPVVGMVMQYYAVEDQRHGTALDPVSTSRSGVAPAVDLSVDAPPGATWQIQRVFNAADEELCEDIRAFAAGREAAESPYGWRKYLKSQELYVRYCGHALIESMLLLDQVPSAAMESRKAGS